MEFDLALRKKYLEYLIDKAVLTEESALEVLDRQQANTPPIGKIALKRGLMNVKQVCKVLAEQIDTNLRFGEQAVQLGFMNSYDLDKLLAMQNDSRPRLGRILQDMGVVDAPQAADLRAKFLEYACHTI